MGTDLDPEEHLAGTLVCSLLGGERVEPRDVDGAPPNTHDLDVHFADGVRLAVEVTSATDGAARKRWDSLGRHEVSAAGLTRAWQVHVQPTARMNDLFKGLAPLLQQLEADGLHRINLREPVDPGASPELWGAVDALRRFRVTYARSIDSDGAGGSVALLDAAEVGSGGGSSVWDALHACVEDEKNQRKLAREGGGDLFVWVDNTTLAAFMALRGTVPDDPLQLPDCVQHVWAAQKVFGRDGWVAGTVWRGDDQGWRVMRSGT